MAQVEFIYKGITTIIPCQRSQKMEEICNNFINKTKIKEKEIYYFYGGKGGAQFDKNLTFEQMANHLDNSRKKMSIVVQDNEVDNNDKSNTTLKNIICPECQNNIKMEIKNYKINLFECKNKHTKNNILFNEFEKTQTIDLTKIKCGICKEKDKSTTFNNEFYKCCDCNINLCPLCKTKHEKNHNVLNYDKINYICTEHNEQFTSYCKKCQINLCFMCEDQHYQHKIFSLAKMMKDKKELNTKLEELKKSKDILNENINKIITILNDVKEMFDMFYKLEENIFNNYNKNERNYELLYNINELINYNNIIKNDINLINNENKIRNKVNYILNIYEYKSIIPIPIQEMQKNSFCLIFQKENNYQWPLGLSNFQKEDSISYINSVLQSFFNLKNLTKYLIDLKDLFLTAKNSSHLLKSFIKSILYLSKKSKDSKGLTENERMELYKNLKNFISFNNFPKEDNNTYTIILGLLELLNKDLFIIRKEESKNLNNFINFKENSNFLLYLKNNGIDVDYFIDNIKEFITKNKSIISNLFFFMIRVFIICPRCHQGFSLFAFQRSIILELEEIIAFKYSNPKNQMFNINLLNPLNLIRPMSFINVKDLINSIEPINLMNQNNIMNLNLQNFVRNPLAQNIMNQMDQNNLRNIMNLIDLKELKDIMNQNNQMNLIDLNKLKNQIYLIEQILSLHLMSVKNLNIPFDEMKDLKKDLKEDLKNLTNQIYSIEPMNPKYSINSFFPNNQMYFLDRKKILPQINLNFNETINKIKNNTKNENSPIDDKELSSKN